MFDGTHSKESWGFVESLYKEYCDADPDFWRVLEAWRTPVGVMRDKDGNRFFYRAPTMMVGNDHYRNLTPEKIDQILADYKAKG